jgi:hypothetical protein
MIMIVAFLFGLSALAIVALCLYAFSRMAEDDPIG